MEDYTYQLLLKKDQGGEESVPLKPAIEKKIKESDLTFYN